jgi:hypothetical protein
MTLLICLSLGISLAGCASAGAAHMATSAAAPNPGAAPALAAKARTDNASAAPARVAANTRKQKSEDSTAAEDEQWWKEGGITREKINAMCWMKYEHGRKDLPLDTRADLVNQCVIDALKEHPLR